MRGWGRSERVEGEQPAPVLPEQGAEIERWDETEDAAHQFAAGRSREGGRETEGNEGTLSLSLAVTANSNTRIPIGGRQR